MVPVGWIPEKILLYRLGRGLCELICLLNQSFDCSNTSGKRGVFLKRIPMTEENELFSYSFSKEENKTFDRHLYFAAKLRTGT